MLRRVEGDAARIWAQTDGPAVVTVTAGPVAASAPTVEIEGAHVVLVTVAGLPMGTTAYEVRVDGVVVWPMPGVPPSVLTIREPDRHDAVIAFGSCRRIAPEEPLPDALETYARVLLAGGHLPDLLLLLGDQIYADDARTFADYAELYRVAWSPPSVRWLLSTVPTMMIFDDHEIADDWNSSARWLDDMSSRPGWSEHLTAGLVSYWVFQHAGNLVDSALDDDPVRGGETAYRWSYALTVGATRVIVLDNRAGRVLTPGAVSMLSPADWAWLSDEATRPGDHLVLACSLPWLLAPVVHHGEAAWSRLSDRSPAAERVRRYFDLEHWPAVGDSFQRLTGVIRAAADGRRGVVVLGGDVHHSYVATTTLPRVVQAVCSGLRNHLGLAHRVLLRAGWWRPLRWPAALAARLARAEPPALRWRTTRPPWFGNAVGTLTVAGPAAIVMIAAPRTGTELAPVAGVRLPDPVDRAG